VCVSGGGDLAMTRKRETRVDFFLSQIEQFQPLTFAALSPRLRLILLLLLLLLLLRISQFCPSRACAECCFA
jgi:hypothetical protein